MSTKEYFMNLVLETGEDLFDGISVGDLSPVEQQRMSDSTEERGILWEDTIG